MNKKTIILLGVAAAVVVAYVLWKRSNANTTPPVDAVTS